MKVAIIIPTLNEIDGVKWFMPRLDQNQFEWLMIPDGGSTDGTFEWCWQNGYQVFPQGGKGLCRAQMDAFAMTEGADDDIVITVSPDGNCLPESVESLIEVMRQGYDMGIVSRYKNGAKSYDDDWLTAFGNRLFTWLINILYGGHFTDSLTIFRAYTRSAIERMGLNHHSRPSIYRKIFPYLESWEVLSTIRATKLGLKVKEIPGDEPKRIGGQRKMNIPLHGTMTLLQILYEKISID